MNIRQPELPGPYQAFLDRFLEICQDDNRIVAALLRGSYAHGEVDAYSDLDVSLVTTDESYEDFISEKSELAERLGGPTFVEDFDSPGILFLIYSDGTEVEIEFGRESDFSGIALDPVQVLLDKTGVLDGASFPPTAVPEVEQIEALRRIIYWFWHDLSHFTTAMARDQLWWGQGQIGILRNSCVNLMRLKTDFTAPVEDYDKLEKAVSLEDLSPLASTFCPLQRDAMLEAGLTILKVFRDITPSLAEEHSVKYPYDLDQSKGGELEELVRANSDRA